MLKFGIPSLSLERSLCLYWNGSSPSIFNYGNFIGEVINKKEKFAVGVDVSQFTPEEAEIHVAGSTLTIEGCHGEKDDAYGSLSLSKKILSISSDKLRLRAVFR